jgi:Ferredoxin-like domain in Api92-like protein
VTSICYRVRCHTKARTTLTELNGSQSIAAFDGDVAKKGAKMPNWCVNHIVVTGSDEDITLFVQKCIGRDEKGDSCFDFNSLTLMPAILEGTVCGGPVDDALLVVGRDELAWIHGSSLEDRMKHWGVADIEALTTKIGPDAFEKARQSIRAFEQTGAPNWYVWSNKNWGTKWNASDFAVISEERGRYECRFETAWSPPEPVYMKLAEIFPHLCFEISGGDDQLNFDFRAKGRDGTFSIQYGDPTREGFWIAADSDSLLNMAKAYGNDPKRFLCVSWCRAVTNRSNSKDEDPESETAVVAWARGDTTEDSENSCRAVVARNNRCIKTLVTDWQFTVYAPGEIQFQAHSELEKGGVLIETGDHPPF